MSDTKNTTETDTDDTKINSELLDSPLNEINNDVNDAAQSDNSSTGKKLSFSAIVIALISLFVLSAGLFWGKTQIDQISQGIEKRLATQQLESSAALSDSQATLVELNESIRQLQSDKIAQTEEMATLQERLSDSIRQLEAGKQRTDADWRLAEAEYLLRLANQRVLMEKRTEGALTLLQSTDEILRELDSVSVYALRQAVASDIAKLETVPDLDIEGTYLRLTALIERTSDLPTLTLEQQKQLPELIDNVLANQTSEETKSAITNGFAKAMAKLESLVVIQHHESNIEPLLSPDQGYYLRQNIQLLLEQAQLALLRQQQGIFGDSLQRANDLLTRFFDTDNHTVSVMTRSLDDLKMLSVAPVIPDISSSLKTLQNHIRETHTLRMEANR